MDLQVMNNGIEERSHATEVEMARAEQQVQAAFIAAKKFPRDINMSYTRIINNCKRLSLAQQAMYKYPRGGEIVTGPSIRLAEVIAQNYGNLHFGEKEVSRQNGMTLGTAYCWDLETNTRREKEWFTPHEIRLKGGKTKKLSDPRDIYEISANMGSRRLRACILAIVPSDIVEGAVKQCMETLAKGGGEPIEDRVRKIILAFQNLGVSKEMLEDRLTHKLELVTPEEIVELTSIFTSIKDKQAKRGDFFNFPEDDKEGGKAEALKKKMEKEVQNGDSED